MLILALVPGAILWRVVLGGHSLSGGDLVNQYIPYKALIVEELRSGEFPHWNPMTFSGRPLQGDIQVGVFYPPNLLFLVLRPQRAFDWLCYAHFVWLAWGALLFFRRVLSQAAAALAASCVFAFSGFFATQLHSGIVLFIFAGAWLPWMLWLCEGGLREGRVGAWLGLGAAGAAQLLAGSPQIAFYSWWIVAAYAFVGVVCLHRASNEPRSEKAHSAPFGIGVRGWLAWAGLGAAALLAAGLTAVQWAPTREFLALSFDRGAGASWEFVTDGSLRLGWLATFLAPFLFQHPANEALYWGSETGYWEFNGFAGALAPALAVAGLGALRRKAGRDERRLAGFALLCIGLWAVLAPGKHSPLFRLAYLCLPGFDRFRVPARWVLSYQLGLALLAGLGWKRLAAAESRRARLAAMSALGILAAAGLALLALRSVALPALLEAKGFGQLLALASSVPQAAYSLREHEGAFARASLRLALSAAACLGAFAAVRKRRFGAAAAAGAVAAILADVGTFAASMVQSVPRRDFAALFYPQTEARRAVAERLKPGERWTWDDSVFDWRVDQNQLELYPNRPILYGLPTPRGYDPVNSLRYSQFSNAAAGLDLDAPPRAFMFLPQIAAPRLLALLNVKAVLSYQSLEGLGYRLAKAFPFGLRVYESAEAVGPAFLATAEVAAAEEGAIAPEPSKVLARLLSSEFDWRGRAVVEEPNPYEGLKPIDAMAPRVETLEQGHGRWRFRVHAPQPSALVLSQSYYPGWRAEVDGRARRTVPADWALTAVFLEPGEHEVAFCYRPKAFDHGLAVSLATLSALGLAALGLWMGGRMRQKKESLAPD